MSDTERVIGRLEEFQKATERRLDGIEKKVDALTAFKWKVAGMMTALMSAAEVAHMWIKK